MRWLLSVLESDSSSRGKFYRGQALCNLRDQEGLVLLRQSADEGFAPAMCALAVAVGVSPAESSLWACKAVHLNDPDGLALWARFVEDESEQKELFSRAAALDSLQGLMSLARLTTDSVHRAILWAKQVVLSGDIQLQDKEVHTCVEAMYNGHVLNRQQVELLYFAGRELEG